MRYSILTKQHVKVGVRFMSEGAEVDISTDPVSLAFPVYGVDPVALDWLTSDWEVVANPAVGNYKYLARTLIGPGSAKTLPVGLYDVWVKVTDNPESPVIQATGMLEIY